MLPDAYITLLAAIQWHLETHGAYSVVKQHAGQSILYMVKRGPGDANLIRFINTHLILTHHDILGERGGPLIFPPIVYELVGSVEFIRLKMYLGVVAYLPDLVHCCFKDLQVAGPNVSIVTGTKRVYPVAVAFKFPCRVLYQVYAFIYVYGCRNTKLRGT
jgi:hypothetical protein